MSMTPFALVPHFLSNASYATESLRDRLAYYFMESDLLPLLVQENYLKARPTYAGKPLAEWELVDAVRSEAGG